MDIQTLFNILGTVISAALGYYITKNDTAIKELQTKLVQVQLEYAKKDEIKEIKDLIERGFDKLEARLDKKVDKDH